MLGYQPYALGKNVRFVLYWQALARLEQAYTVFVHIVDEAGQIVIQGDTQPRGGEFPTTAWPVREVIDDAHTISLPADMPAGEYRIVLGLYELESGTRLPVRDHYDQELGGGAVILAKIRVL